MTTLVVYVDRDEDVGRVGPDPPVVGRDAVLDLVTRIGLADPEDAAVNCLLETVRAADELEERGTAAIVAVVAGADDTAAAGDRAIAAQLDTLVDEHGVAAAIVVTDSAESERLLPVIESRVNVDAVDRVVVRQARDIESTYYLLKQFLADEELRGTVLVPAGVTLVAFPLIQAVASTAVAVAAISTVIGVFLLYKGLGWDTYVEDLPAEAREALYSGQVSVVTYVVAAMLVVVGLFVGGLGASTLDEVSPFLAITQFLYDAAPWLAGAALAASTGRLLDDLIGDDPIRRSSVNLPFVAVAVGLILRGFAGYFLDRAGLLPPARVPSVSLGALSLNGFPLSRGARLALFILAGVVVSLAGVRAAAVVTPDWAPDVTDAAADRRPEDAAEQPPDRSR